MEERIKSIKNTESMKKIAGYKGQRFTNLELKNALMDVQEQLLKTTFEKSHAENLNYNDLYNYFKSVASDYGLIEDEHYSRFSRNLKNLKGTIGTLIAGEIGERRVSNALRVLNLEGAISLYNIELQATEHDHTEIDCIVVDHSGIHMLEVKNYRSDIVITETGEIIEDGNEKYSYSIGVKNNEKEFAVKNALREAGVSIPEFYESILVIADNKVNVEDRYGSFPVCYAGNIVSHLRKKQDIYLSDDDINRIVDSLNSANCPNRYSWDGIDFEEFVDDYAHLMALIEKASKDITDVDNAIAEKTPSKKANKYNQDKKTLHKCILSALGGAAITSAIFVIKSAL